MNNVAVTMMNKVVRDRYYKTHKPKKTSGYSLKSNKGITKSSIIMGEKKNDK